VTDKPLKAYAVTEPEESTGAIVFAVDNIRARKIGAAEYNDGELGGMTCKRAPWADLYQAEGVPASVMVDHGWHFECHGCSRRIDSDMADWRYHVHDGTPFRIALKLARRYRKWTPDRMIGTQYGAFCTTECYDDHIAYEVERKRRQDRAIDRFKTIVARRFPGVEFVHDDRTWGNGHHAYATTEKGKWVVRQVSVSFNFPGMKYGPASLRWDHGNRWRNRGKPEKPHYSCFGGDKDAFEAWARDAKP